MQLNLADLNLLFWLLYNVAISAVNGSIVSEERLRAGHAAKKADLMERWRKMGEQRDDASVCPKSQQAHQSPDKKPRLVRTLEQISTEAYCLHEPSRLEREPSPSNFRKHAVACVSRLRLPIESPDCSPYLLAARYWSK